MLIRGRWRAGGAALVALSSLLLAGAAHAQLSPAQKALEDQGRYWEDRHQPDRASVAWQKLLESDPDNAEALTHLGIIEARVGRLDQAKSYAARLKTAHPDAPENAVLDRAIQVGAINPNDIEEARKLARAGKYDEAIAAYKKALNGQSPPPDLAQEYYETLAGTKTGWDEARTGLQELSAALKDDLSVQYAYARVLTYHEETRRDGIAIMASLSTDPSVGRQATQGWHDALIWLGGTKADVPLYQAYLNTHSDDAAVTKKLASIENPPPGTAGNGAQGVAGMDEAHRSALAALNAGHLKEAAQQYEALVHADDKDVDALGGLGVVYERMGRLHDAHELLARAVSLEPEGDTRWRDALASTIDLETVAQAKAALRSRDYKEAERLYRGILHDHPNDRGAQAGLQAVLVATGRAAEARRYGPIPAAAGQGPGPEQSASDAGRAEANALAMQAKARLNAGDVKGAVDNYKRAMAAAPGNPWIRLDYARLLERVGDRAGADREIAAMMSAAQPSTDTLAAGAIWYGEHGQFETAAHYAEMVPADAKSKEFPGMERQWVASRDARKAVALYRKGQVQDAYRILDGIAAGAQGNIGVYGVVADAYVEIGDAQRAIAVMRAGVTGTPTLDALIQYAGVLLKVNALEELTKVMHQIDEQATHMVPAQQARIADLHRGLAIKLADQARLHGDFAGAYDRLAPELAISRDVTMLAALARIYESAGRREDALEIQARILRADPTNIDAAREIITAAIALGDYDRAEKILNDSLTRWPDDPRFHLIAAELARVEGDAGRALAELTKAQELLAARGTRYWLVPDQYGYYGPPSYVAAYGVNPFRDDMPAPAPAAPLPTQYYPTYYSVYPTGATYGTNPAYPVPEVATRVAFAPPTTDDQELARQVATELEEVNDSERAFIQGGVGFRNIDGETGLSQFSLVALPVTGGAQVGPGQLTLQATPTFADSGALDNSNPGVFRRFGTDATLPKGATFAPSYEGNAEGIAVAVGYSLPNLAAEFGLTPVGFPTLNWVGHLVWVEPLDAETSIKLTGLREPVADSLLAYAGTKDPLSGDVWGGVTRTGGRVDIGYDNGVTGIYGDVTGAVLNGTHVEQNWMIDGGGGAYWRFWRSPWGDVKLGANVSAQTYEKNEDFFTLGEGGYFSPQFAVEATIPVEFSGRWGRLTYDLAGQIGVMNFHEDSAPYFPLDPGLQALAEAHSPISTYSAEDVTTFLYGISAKAEYEVAPLLVVGVSASADNAHDFNEQSFLLYLRKKFDTD
jgi:cellulose synthase operon protein C